MARDLDECECCGEVEYSDALFKGLCEPCLDKLHPGKAICDVCGDEWATYEPPLGLQAPATCDGCADHGARLAYCLQD